MGHITTENANIKSRQTTHARLNTIFPFVFKMKIIRENAVRSFEDEEEIQFSGQMRALV
jgi:hypothetical protein